MTTSTPSPEVKTIARRTHVLFSEFAVFYGHIWKSQFKDDKFLNFAKEKWQKRLDEFDESVLEKAMTECLNQYEMPPTLPQFLKLCRYFLNRHKDLQPSVEAEIPRASKEVARMHLQNILNKLPKKGASHVSSNS